MFISYLFAYFKKWLILLTTTTDNTNSTLDNPGLVQYCLVTDGHTPTEQDWLNLPLFASSTINNITGLTIGAPHSVGFESLYAPILGVIHTLEVS